MEVITSSGRIMRVNVKSGICKGQVGTQLHKKSPLHSVIIQSFLPDAEVTSAYKFRSNVGTVTMTLEKQLHPPASGK